MDKALYPGWYVWTRYCILVGMYGQGIVSWLVCMDKVLYPDWYVWTRYCILVGMYGQGIVS